MTHHTARWALLCLLAACAPVNPIIELGTGELEYETLADGDDLVVIRGPQGGYHVLSSMRTAGIDAGNRESLTDPNNPTTTFRLFVGEEQLAPNARYTQGLQPIDGGGDWTHQMVGRFAVLDIRDDDEIVGQEARFEVEITEASGDVFTDERTVMLVAHPLND